MNYHVAARQAVEPIVDRAAELGYKKRLSQIYTILGAFNSFSKEDCDQALRYGEKALSISQELNDWTSQVFANFWIGIPLAYNCEFHKALSNMKQALAIYEKANSLWGASITRSLMSGYVHFYQGAARLSYETSNEAIQIAEKSGDTHSRSFAYGCHGISCCCLGFFEEAANNLLRSICLAESIEWAMFNADANSHAAELYYHMGEYEKSGDHHHKAAQILERNELLPSLMRLNRMGIARARVTKGERDIDVEALHACIEESREGAKIYEGWMRRMLGEILYHIGDQRISEAENWIGAAIEADKRNDMLFHLGQDYACYAELLKRKGDQSKAKETLAKAIDIYKECGSDGWVEKSEKQLAELGT
jgi:tetratricopeptide (TPR) repeat protein